MLMLNGDLGKGADRIAGVSEVVFSVPSVTASHQLFSERGCRFLNQPREVTPGYWAVTLTDPDENRLTLFGPK